jgi:chromosome segregation ATPase
VVRNDPLQGTRRSLVSPLTLIGHAPGCDIRLSGENVSPYHCAVVDDGTGPILRDLGSPAGTLVNGQPAVTHRLADGDTLEIGPFQFAVSLGTPRTAEVASAAAITLDREHEALRIQAAAVAAQQAALLEEEARLEQRATALQLQEVQLASHLQERQRQLDDDEEQLRRERDELARERTALRETLQREQQELTQTRAAATAELHKAVSERKRLTVLRRRMNQRWHRHFDAHEAGLKKQEEEVAAATERVNRERARVVAFQERTNSELELSRQELRESWQELGLSQQRWDEALNLEKAQRERQQQAVAALAAQVEAEARALAEEQERQQQRHEALAREAEGLEARIRNQREQLDILARAASSEVAPAAAPLLDESVRLPVAATAEALPGEALPEQVVELAGMLDDQRRHLAEQWQRLLEVQESWQQERTAALAELESAAAGLARRDGEIQAAARALDAQREELRRRQEGLSQLRGALEGWHGRLTAEEAGWQSARDGLLAQLESRERLLQVRSAQLEEVHQRRNRRRRQELAEVQAARARCDEVRRQYSTLWQDHDRLRGALERQERDLASRALALERYRQEVVDQAPNSARAESRLEKLQRRDAARLEAEARDLLADRARLQQERALLDEQAARMHRMEEDLSARQHELATRVGEHEAQRAAAEEEEQRRQEELRLLRAQHALDERQLRQLREEVERLARAMIEEAEEPPPSQQAA